MVLLRTRKVPATAIRTRLRHSCSGARARDTGASSTSWGSRVIDDPRRGVFVLVNCDEVVADSTVMVGDDGQARVAPKTEMAIRWWCAGLLARRARDPWSCRRGDRQPRLMLRPQRHGLDGLAAPEPQGREPQKRPGGQEHAESDEAPCASPPSGTKASTQVPAAVVTWR